MTLLERVGGTLRRWRPWPQVVVYGGGGALFVAAAFLWTAPGATFRFWFRLVLGTAMIVVAAIDLWLVWMEKRQKSVG